MSAQNDGSSDEAHSPKCPQCALKGTPRSARATLVGRSGDEGLPRDGYRRCEPVTRANAPRKAQRRGKSEICAWFAFARLGGRVLGRAFGPALDLCDATRAVDLSRYVRFRAHGDVRGPRYQVVAARMVTGLHKIACDQATSTAREAVGLFVVPDVSRPADHLNGDLRRQ